MKRKLMRSLIPCLIIVITVITFILVFTLTPKAEELALYNKSGTLNKSIAKYYNSELSELTVYDYNLFTSILQFPGFYYGFSISSRTDLLYPLSRNYPIQRIEKEDSETIYVIYKLKKDNEEILYKLKCTRENTFQANIEDGIKFGFYEIWRCVGLSEYY